MPSWAVLAVALVTAGCGSPVTRVDAVPPVVVTASVKVVAEDDGQSPEGFAFLPDGTTLVADRNGRISSIGTDGRLGEAVPGTSVGLLGGGQLGIAVSPTYAVDRWIYLYHAWETGGYVSRLRLGQPPQTILTGIPGDAYFNCGQIVLRSPTSRHGAGGDVEQAVGPEPGRAGIPSPAGSPSFARRSMRRARSSDCCGSTSTGSTRPRSPSPATGRCAPSRRHRTGRCWWRPRTCSPTPRTAASCGSRCRNACPPGVSSRGCWRVWVRTRILPVGRQP